MKKLPRLLLSAGHCPGDSGARYGDADFEGDNLVTEHDITTKLVMYVMGQLWNVNSRVSERVVVIPSLPLVDKVAVVNRWTRQAHQEGVRCLAVELHVNSAPDPRASGIQTFYYPGNRDALKITDILMTWVKNRVPGHPIRNGMDTRGLGRKLAWIHDTVPTALVVEVGFLTNDEDRAMLVDDRRLWDLAGGIADGLESSMLWLQDVA